MLVHLSIRNYAIVDQLDLDFDSGMTVISGETGAGKSIMLDALALALGDRADSTVVRPGSDKADILASFDIGHIPEAQNWLKERDLEQDGTCLLRRVITREGRSRGYINGTASPLADLKALGEILIDIHSQHEHQSLLKTETHRRLLDEFANCQELASQVRFSAQRWKQAQQELERLSNVSDEQHARCQLLSYQLEEFDRLALAEQELEQLEQEHKTLSNADQLLATCRQVTELCSENDTSNVLSALNSCLNSLAALGDHSGALQEATDLLSSAQIQIEEAVAGISRFVDHFDSDPQRQQEVEERLDCIYTLARKHRIQPVALPALQQSLRDELASLNADDRHIEGLTEELAEHARQYQEQASQLREYRQNAAKRLSQAVAQEMQQLGMPGGRFLIELKDSVQHEPQPHGLEQIEFMVSANPGQPARPLAKVASGGELSRISLAIQTITAQTSRVPTLVFDEVDVGIGGPTAEVVGQLLRRLSEKGQILTVTHLPQVAAQGNHHLFVHKIHHEDATRTAVTKLAGEQRAKEIARMLGGMELTNESLAHARQMIDKAKAP